MTKKIMDKFLAKASKLSPKVAEHVESAITDVISPWYEAATGKYPTERMIRKLVSAQVDGYLSGALWAHRNTFEDLDNAIMFKVTACWPQATGTGSYVINVAVMDKDDYSNKFAIELSQFLHNFAPVRPIVKADLNS
jgi:hypothetical protein